MFAPSSNKSLNDKLELYFNDHEFSYLMIQENYLKTNPSRSTNLHGRERNLKNLELIEAAAASIADGDLVDAMIHGPQQHWSLMPVHGIFSTVAPSYYAHGSYGGQMFGFTSWLGMTSKQTKLTRYVKEIQSHMRLRASGDRHEIRESYLPVLWNRLVKKLELDGKEAIPEVIELMDDYFLTRDDFDAIVELGVGSMSDDKLQIPTQVKSSFTREYNSMGHPLPFMKPSMSAAAATLGSVKAKKEVPDLEEAIEESDGEAAMVDEEEAAKKVAEEETDLTKDKYVKAKKPGTKARGAAAKRTTAAASSKGKGGKGKKAKEESDDNDDESDEVVSKPKRGSASVRGGSSAAGRGRGRGRK